MTVGAGALIEHHSCVLGQEGSSRVSEALRQCSAVVVEDADVLRAGLVQTLRRLGCTVVADGAVGDDMFGAMLRHAPDLVIIGSHSERRTSEMVRLLKSVAFHVKAVHLATTTDREEFVAMLKAGTDAIVPLSIRADDLGEVLARVLGGERVYEGIALAAVRPTLESTVAPKSPLSPREREVLAKLASRTSMAGIASELYISIATVKTHSARIYDKLDAQGRNDAVERAVAMGLLA